MCGLLNQAINTGKAFSIESKTRLPDDTRLWIRSNVAPIFDQSGAVRYLIVVADDVTVRREAEENLINEHQNLLKTLDERATSLKQAREVLHVEMEKRKRVEDALQQEIAKRRKAQEAIMQNEWRFRTVIPRYHRLCYFHAGSKWVYHELEHGCARHAPVRGR
jgi:hypothetical protein